MVHEITHMFGVLHCMYYQCIMNGSNQTEEYTIKPAELCPICLRKLQRTIGFNISERYKELSKLCESFGGSFLEAGHWYQATYDLVMKKYGSNYQKYLDELKSHKKQPEPEPLSKLLVTQPTKPKAKGLIQKITMIDAKIKIDDQVDLYKGL